MKIRRKTAERTYADTAREQRGSAPVRFCKEGCPGHTGENYNGTC